MLANAQLEQQAFASSDMPAFSYRHVWRPPEPNVGRHNSEWVRDQILKLAATPTPGGDSVNYEDTEVRGSDIIKGQGQQEDISSALNGINHGPPAIDTSTLRWKSWASSSPAGGSTVSLVDDQADRQESALYKITQTEFKRLTDALPSKTPNRYRGNGFKKYHTNEAGENVPLVHRTQLAASLKASLKAFQDRRWLPYQPSQELPDRTPTNSRPTTASSKAADIRRAQIRRSGIPPLPPHRQRPKSVPAHRLPPGRENGPNYDCLTPQMVYELSEGVQPESVYGERPESSMARLHEAETEGPEAAERGSIKSPDNEDADVHVVFKSSNKFSQALQSRDSDQEESDPTEVEQDQDQEQDRDDADSEHGDAGPEPKVEDINMNNIPHLNLRPEKIDHIHVPAQKGDRKKYDFDANVLDIPLYDFKYPLPEELKGFNFRNLSRGDGNWSVMTKYKAKDVWEERYIGRLIELEKLQRKTEDYEHQRKYRLQSAKYRSRTVVNNTMRTQTNKLVRETKKCAVDCVQMACVGDCPSKRDIDPGTICTSCSNPNCPGNCKPDIYEAHSRKVEEPDPRRLPTTIPNTRPRSSMQPNKPNNIKPSFTTHPGRPKSSLPNPPTMIPPRHQHPLPVRGPIRPRTAAGIDHSLEREFSQMELESQDDDKLKPRHRGRAGLVPGKSYFSQRRDSLTDISREIKIKAMTKKSRVKSGKKKRPKTAV